MLKQKPYCLIFVYNLYNCYLSHLTEKSSAPVVSATGPSKSVTVTSESWGKVGREGVQRVDPSRRRKRRPHFKEPSKMGQRSRASMTHSSSKDAVPELTHNWRRGGTFSSKGCFLQELVEAKTERKGKCVSDFNTLIILLHGDMLV